MRCILTLNTYLCLLKIEKTQAHKPRDQSQGYSEFQPEDESGLEKYGYTV